MEKCIGDGTCIMSEYISTEKISCLYNCSPKRCLNFLVCDAVQPEFYIMTTGLCFGCEISLKQLTFISSVDCPRCFIEKKPGVMRLNCSHILCIDCFKDTHYGEYIEPPVFPYSSHIRFQYYENQYDDQWTKDPQIIKYQEDLLEYEKRLIEKNKSKMGLRVCPECE